MIRRIAVIAQGPNDVGFLHGLKDRLRCDAEIVDYSTVPILRRRNKYTPPKEMRLILRHVKDTDLLVRLTDADKDRWQEVTRREAGCFSQQFAGRFICGVCDRDVENWMLLHKPYAARVLHFQPEDIPSDRADRSRFVKSKISSILGGQRDHIGFVARFVREAPADAFAIWLKDPAFSRFYDECVAAARQVDCPVNDERSPSDV